MQKKQTLLLGAHMSIAGGIEQSILRAEQIGCTAVQFFSKSNRQWKTKPLTESEITAFKETFKKSSITSATIHASYLINIGSPNAETSNRSRDALADEFNRAQQLGVDHLVFHPGSHLKKSEPDCLQRIAEQINYILEGSTQNNTLLTLETMAGQGTNVCYSFEHLAYILEKVEQKNRIGICLDTCHIFAAGYDIKEKYQEVMQSFDDIIGLKYLKVIHINDSKKPCGSRVDRHEHIGEGQIGLEAFKQLMNDPRLAYISKILETPKDSAEDDIKNIATLKALITE
ncbi:MAG: deoxyribonuclease IV [Candidatus Dependentiae bacterium]